MPQRSIVFTVALCNLAGLGEQTGYVRGRSAYEAVLALCISFALGAPADFSSPTPICAICSMARACVLRCYCRATVVLTATERRGIDCLSRSGLVVLDW